LCKKCVFYSQIKMGKEATNSVNVDEVNHNYHITVLILCFTCIVICIYLYSSIAFKSEVVSVFMKDSIDDLEVLKYKLELFFKTRWLIYSLMKELKSQEVQDQILVKTSIRHFLYWLYLLRSQVVQKNICVGITR
jgi:hypothetical protein